MTARGMVHYEGRDWLLGALAQAHGLSRACLAYRLSIGMPLKTALRAPVSRGKIEDSLAAKARAAGLKPRVVQARIQAGWPLERALSEPSRHGPRSALADAARAHGVPPRLASERVRDGWSFERATTTPPPARVRTTALQLTVPVPVAELVRARAAQLGTTPSRLVASELVRWLGDASPGADSESGESPVRGDSQILEADPVAANTAENAQCAGVGRIRG